MSVLVPAKSSSMQGESIYDNFNYLDCFSQLQNKGMLRRNKALEDLIRYLT